MGRKSQDGETETTERNGQDGDTRQHEGIIRIKTSTETTLSSGQGGDRIELTSVFGAVALQGQLKTLTQWKRWLGSQ